MPAETTPIAKWIAEVREWFGLALGGLSGGGLLGFLGGIVRERRRREDRMVQVFREEGEETRKTIRESMGTVHRRLDGVTAELGEVKGRLNGRR